MKDLAKAVVLAGLLLTCGGWRSGSGGADVTTQYMDNGRTGWNQRESILSPEGVRSSGFGTICSRTDLDGEIDGQPLHLRQSTVTGLTADTIYVGTGNNTVYALNARTCATITSVNLGTAVDGSHVSGGGCETNPPGSSMGIRPTMVIDLTLKTLFVLAAVWDGANVKHYMHALDLVTLADKVSAAQVSGSAPISGGGTYTFDAGVSHPRAGLVFAGGNVYAAYGSYCDFGADLTRGWLFGWDGATLAPLVHNELTNTAVRNSPDNYYLTSIWQAGQSPAADSSGSVYFVTGNGGGYAAAPGPPDANTNTVMKVSGDLATVQTSFTPYQELLFDQFDQDLGSSGITLLPDNSGPNPHLALVNGKQGGMYVLDRDSMGGFVAGGPDAVLSNINIGAGSACAQHYFEGADGNPRLLTCAGGGGSNYQSIWTLDTSVNPPTITIEHADIANGLVNGGSALNGVASYLHTKHTIWLIDRPCRSCSVNVNTLAFDASGNHLKTMASGTWDVLDNLMSVSPVVASGRVIIASNGKLYVFGMVPR